MNEKTILKMHKDHLKGMSFTMLGKKYGLKRQMAHYFIKSRNLPTRKRNIRKMIVYNNLNYTPMNTGYFRKTIGDRQLLHRQVWIDNYGPIPKGMDIHHLDYNKENNRINNLEIISHSEHSSKYPNRQNQHKKNKAHILKGLR